MEASARQAQATSFLRKAKEYLAVAEDSLAQGRLTAAAGNAMHAGINAKDAIVVSVTGSTGKRSDHQQAVKELRLALEGTPDAAQYEKVLRELVSAKSEVEYGVFMIGETQAKGLLRRAQTLVTRASRAVVS